ncbi:putative Aryl-alcohol dehydrogenase (NADP(+)) [Sphingomonas sp. T1]|uniref:aldo/keto reductase n=1 Tax=Sphingomonas sp. T1 TaxID=2653172 RepID=UPI0012F34DB7|nr:aldo/keto reductase [Sphingomonas sp. T1]VXD07244.1 putative Aryl-alcohol dehydrogenase (NADP(+)) [Sphingomonas sp. T1]
MISFTGSTPAGRGIVRLAYESDIVKRLELELELGGDSPIVVLADADLDLAVEAAVFGKFLHQGQICMIANRIIVEAPLYDAFVEKFAARVKGLKRNGPDDPETFIGPIIKASEADREPQSFGDIAMRYNKFGKTGLFVSELCLGTMTFGGEGAVWDKIGDVTQEAADELVRAALDAGINFIDTANVYSGGRSEEILGRSLKNLGIARDEVVIATKGSGQMGEGQNGRGNTRYHLIDACKASLDRLQLDHIDLYQIHGFDPATPIEETLRALDTLVQHGQVRYVGVSNWAAWQIATALGMADRLNLHRFASLQAYYTVAGRDLERELVPMLNATGLGLMVWSPLAGGLLSGKYDREGQSGEGRRANFDFPPVNRDRAFDVIDVMKPIADVKGVSVAQIALAWLLHQSAVTSVIIGAKRPEQLADNLAAVDVVLSADELEELDKVSQLPAEYPGWMFGFQGKGRQDQLDSAGSHRR